VNYLKHLGGEDDELQSIQDKLKQLQHKENLYAAIENLKFSISTENTLRRMAHSQDDEKVLSWLGSNTAQNNHNTARKKHEPTTGNWFLQSETFTQWSNATKSSLWLYGKAGSGKTILCSTIIERIIEICGSSNPADKCAYFYFDFQAKWNVDDMLRSIIVQFCASKREVPRELHHLHQECLDGRRQPRKSSLLEILFSLLTTSSRTFVILDALDECINRADLLDTIEEIVKVSTKYLNVVVTSRKERDIDKRLKTLFVYDVALEENVIDSDITLHIHECLKNDAELRTWDLETKNNIEQALLKGAHGMYYYLNIER
jgi:Cdc6-like AAA superfamily ATPase